MTHASYYFFGSNDTLRALCESTLEASPVCSTVQAQALIKITQQHLPQFIVVDFEALGQKTLHLLVHLRQALPAASVPLVIIADLDALEASQQEALFQFPHSLTIAPQHIAEDLKWQLEMTLEGHSLDRSDIDPHPYALELLARIWRFEFSGQLERIDNQMRIDICKGGLTSSHGIRHIKEGLYGEGFRFYPASQTGLGDWISIGQILWKAAKHRTAVGFLKNRLYLSVAKTPHCGRLTAIELPEQLRTFIAESSELPLKDRFRAHGLRPTQMEQDIEALFMLGLIQFQKFTPPEGPLETEDNSKAPTSISTDLFHMELEALQNANDWEVLGMTPTLNIAQVRYSAVLRKKYHKKYLSLHGQTIDARPLYQIIQRIDTACASIISLVKTYYSFGISELPTDEANGYFQEGHRALFRRDYRTAHGCFEEAMRLNPRSGMMTALAAWSAVLVGKYAIALEQIEQAQALQPVHPFIERCHSRITKQLMHNLSA